MSVPHNVMTVIMFSKSDKSELQKLPDAFFLTDKCTMETV